MHVRRVAVHDPEEFDQYYEVWRAADRWGRERPATPSRNEARGLFSQEIRTDVFEGFSGFDGGALVCAGFTNYSTADNLDLIAVHVSTDPERTGRGYGSEMLGHLVERAHELRRHTLVSRSWVPFEERTDHRYLQFATRHDFAVANVEVRRLLDLPVASARIDAWIAASAPLHTDYRVSTHIGKVPSDLVPSLCHVMNQLGVEAPSGDIELEPRGITPEIFAAREQRAAEADKVMLLALALDADDRLVGFTNLSIPGHEDEVAYQYGTLVLREHRGHRLGMAMKAASLHLLQERFTDRTYIDTINAEQNGPMVGINEEIGFRPVELRTAFKRVTTDHRDTHPR